MAVAVWPTTVPRSYRPERVEHARSEQHCGLNFRIIAGHGPFTYISPVAVAIASILQESNNFSPVRTHYDDFSPVFGDAVLERHHGKLTEMGGFIDTLSAAGVPIEPICAAWAITANRLVRRDLERLTHEFLARLRAIDPPQALLFAMHGAQTAESADDTEGYLLRLTREALGPDIPIVVTLDLHANVTRAIVEHASAIVGYQTYPHIDMFETGVRGAKLALRILSGEVQPAMAMQKLPLIVPAENMQTTSGPMHLLIERGKALEKAGETEIVSIFGVQPWLDIPEMGCSVVVVTNGDQRAAERHASDLASDFWRSRREFDVELTPVDKAIRQALAVDGGPVVFAESSDSTGSGSPGDSTGVLRPLLEAGLQEPAAIFLVDPEAVGKAAEAGAGATVTMRIGGKFDRKNSRPVKVTGHVRMISDGRWTAWGKGYNTGIETCMGRSVVLEVGQVRILIAERSAMTVDPELFRSHGIEPLRMKIVVVKSPNGFRAEYEPIAKKIFLVDTPGVSSANLSTLPFRRVSRPIYPLDTGVRFSAGKRQ
jgi:microcystin degradation protein MlrC